MVQISVRAQLSEVSDILKSSHPDLTGTNLISTRQLFLLGCGGQDRGCRSGGDVGVID